MSRDINPFALRMPPEVRAKVEEAAKQNHRSLNAEILARIESSLVEAQQAEQIADLVAQKLKNELARMNEGKL